MSISQSLKKSMWSCDQSTVELIVDKGIQRYLTSIKGYQQFFELRDYHLRCIDGRTPGGIHLAGSGVLLGVEQTIKILNIASSRIGSIDAVTWHKDCGAAKVKALELGSDPTKLARDFAKDLAYRLGIEALEVNNQGEDGFHHERAIYYDGTGVFDWSCIKGLPAGFIISRAYLDIDPHYAQSELKMALEISLGSHGFGDFFSKSEPLLIIPIAENPSHLNIFLREIKQVVSRLEPALRGCVKLEAFLK